MGLLFEEGKLTAGVILFHSMLYFV